MKNKISIIGKGASGKDYLVNKLMKSGFTRAVAHTTRPIRANEYDGIDYNYIENDKFDDIVSKGDMKFYQSFYNNTWHYGHTNESWDKSNLFIMTPHNIKSLDYKSRSELLVIYLDIPLDIRESRLINRNDPSDDMVHRITTDEIKFNGFTDYDIIINDHKYTYDDIYKSVLTYNIL